MILFLDFDGVLHPNIIGTKLFCCTNQLWKILRACPDVLVVFSTSWRESYRPEELLDFVTFDGGEDLAHRFVGQTPRILTRSDYDQRGLECQRWLEENGHSDTPWLALDDMPEIFPPGCPTLYRVYGSIGLTDADAITVIERVQGVP